MPEDKFFRYNKKIDRDIVRVAEAILETPIEKAVKMEHGEVNHVYKLITSKGTFITKVFKQKYWPEKDKLPWIEGQLAKHNIPHAKTVFYDRTSKYFPNGLIISEFLPGMNGEDAIKRKKTSVAVLSQKTGSLLRKIHKIRIERYGQVKNGAGEHTDYLVSVLKQLRDQGKHLIAKKALTTEMLKQAIGAAEKYFSPYARKFKPVLVHRDASKDNVVLGDDGVWYLVDWDNAKASIWMEDLAVLTFWCDWKRSQQAAKARRAIVWSNFLKGYGKVPFKPEELLKIEKFIHVVRCIDMMAYYYFNKRNKEEFAITKKKLERLLK